MPRTKQYDVDFASIAGWEELESADRSSVESKTNSARSKLGIERESRLSIGQNLYEIRDILKPKKMWLSFLEVAFGWSERTAYRYINDYEMANSNVHKPVLAVAIQRGTKGICNLKLLKKMPPPKTSDPKIIGEYLDKVDGVKLPSLVPEPTVDERIKLCLHAVGNHYDKIHDKRQRTAFMRSLIGMELTRFGIASELSITPIAIPDDFRVVRGRPKENIA